MKRFLNGGSFQLYRKKWNLVSPCFHPLSILHWKLNIIQQGSTLVHLVFPNCFSDDISFNLLPVLHFTWNLPSSLKKWKVLCTCQGFPLEKVGGYGRECSCSGGGGGYDMPFSLMEHTLKSTAKYLVLLKRLKTVLNKCQKSMTIF